MNDFDIKLSEFQKKYDEITSKEFDDFHELEVEYCNLINEGGKLRAYLLEHPEICDKASYLFLTNKIHNINSLDKKYTPIINVLHLTVKLLEKYNEFLKELLDEKRFEEAIRIYEQMANLTRNLGYKKNIMLLYKNELGDIDKAYEICKEYKDTFINDAEFYDEFCELALKKGDKTYSKELHQIAEEIKLKDKVKVLLDEKKYDDAVKIYKDLAKSTGNLWYKKEIANIYAVIYNDVPKAIKLYKKIQSEMEYDKDYWWQLSDLYRFEEKYYNQVLCMKNAIDIELGYKTKEGAK